jgi:hypothetical protein
MFTSEIGRVGFWWSGPEEMRPSLKSQSSGNARIAREGGRMLESLFDRSQDADLASIVRR